MTFTDGDYDFNPEPVELEAGSDEERCWRNEWMERLMFGWMIGQRDPGAYEEWLTAQGARLV